MITLDSIFTGAAGILLVHSFIKMITDREPDGSPQTPGSPPQNVQQASASTPLRRPKRKMSPRTRQTRQTRRTANGSVCGIMQRNSGVSLFVRPLCWTDQHSQLLGIQFKELPPCDTPVPINVPGSPPSKGHMQPSKTITTLSATLTDILSQKIAHPVIVSNAMRTIMSTLWPNSFRRSLLPELHLYFGDKVYREVVRSQILWNHPSSSCLSTQESFISSQSTQLVDSQSASQPYPSTSPNSMLTGMPMVCYMGKAQLASIRRNMYRIHQGPNGLGNEPVYSLQQKRSKNIQPKNPDEDSYIAGVLLAMAQKHFYSNPQFLSTFLRTTSSLAKDAKPFRDVKVRLMTHDCETAEFIVYTGHVTATFLERFRRPHRVPRTAETEDDLGMKIDYARVPIWPILGLRERLGKALGEDVVGEFDPAVMERWEEDDVETPVPSGKRKLAALDEVLNGSLEDTDEEPTSPVHAKKQRLEQGPPLEITA